MHETKLAEASASEKKGRALQTPDDDRAASPAEAQIPRKTGERKRRTTRSKRSSTAAQRKVIVSAEQLPRKSLEQALRVARALRDTLAGGPATWEEIASAMGISAGTQVNKYYLWSASGYGLIEKDADRFQLTEVGRKMLAPTKPNEDKEAAVRAVLTPVVFSRFFTDYNGMPFPAEEHLGNVLEVRYEVPRERVEEAKTLLRENGLFAGILRQDGDTMIVRLDPTTTGVPTPPDRLTDGTRNARNRNGNGCDRPGVVAGLREDVLRHHADRRR